MTKYYYHKAKSGTKRRALRMVSILVFCSGIIAASYIFFPLVSWQLYFAPIFASHTIATPIPQTTVINTNTITSLVSQASEAIRGTDYTNAQNWFPTYKASKQNTAVSEYTLSIPTLGITDAFVTTTDYDLSRHLVHFSGTAIPPNKGNAVVFGHSTLPQLFNTNDYKTIFATLYKIRAGEEIIVRMQNITYTYKVVNITVVNPHDTSALSQQYDNAYLTLITCTPPGTTWKRLVVKARLEHI